MKLLAGEQVDERSRPCVVEGTLLARNTTLNLIGAIAPISVALLTVPYVVARLGAERFGVLSLAWLIVGYFSLLNLGLGPATTRFAADALGKQDRHRVGPLLWTSLCLSVGLGIVGAGVLSLSTPFLVAHFFKVSPQVAGATREVFLLMAASFPIMFAAGAPQGALSAAQRFDVLNAVNIPSNIVNFIIPAAGVWLGFDIPAIVGLMVVFKALTAAVLLFFCFREFPTLRTTLGFERHLAMPLLTYGGWVTVSNGVGPILVYLDRILLGGLLSVAALGYYSPSATMAFRVSVIPVSLVTTLFPAFSASASAGNYDWIERAFVRACKYLLLTVGPLTIVIAVFRTELLTAWLGEEYARASGSALMILAIGMLANSLAYVPYSLLQGMGRPDVTAKCHLLELPLHVVLTWYLVRSLGITGAALAWTLRVTVDTILLFGAAFLLCRVSPRLFYHRSVARTGLMVLTLGCGALAVSRVTHSGVAQLASIITLGGLFALVAYSCALEADERATVRVMVAGFFRSGSSLAEVEE